MTTQTLRTRRDIREIGGWCYWVVYGPAGVVTWNLRDVERSSTDFGTITVHSPRPLAYGLGPDDDCPWLEMPCYVEPAHLAGERLGATWRTGGQDDDLIWAELKAWYADRLTGQAATRS